MNKGVTFLILGVVLAAMAIVFYSHLSSAPDSVATGQDLVFPDDPTDFDDPRQLAALGTEDEVESASVVLSPSGRENLNITESSRPVEKLEPEVIEVPSSTAPLVKESPKAATEQPKAPTQAPARQETAKSPEIAKSPEKPVEKAVEKSVEKPVEKAELKAVETSSTASGPSLKPLGGPDAKDAGPSLKVPEQTPGQVLSTQVESGKAPEKATEEISSAQSASSLTPLSQLSKTAKHKLQSIGLHFYGQAIYLKLVADSAFPYKVFYLPDPDRLVLDLPGNWEGISAPEIPSNQLINKVRIGQQDAGPRLVLDLSRESKYEIKRISDSHIELVME